MCLWTLELALVSKLSVLRTSCWTDSGSRLHD
jgi:hypothetical protein